MKTYVDSGVLVKLYSWEAHSEEVATLVSRLARVPLVPLHELEIRNALRAQRGRAVITPRQLAQAIRAFDDDIRAGRLVRVRVDWSEAFLAAEGLSRKWTAPLLCRSLDVLHVALAGQLHCQRFVTGDSRQARLAKAAGLQPVHIAAQAG